MTTALRKIVQTAAVLFCAAAVLLALVPQQAHALETTRWTAKSNQDGGTNIMGATPTRVTWEGQAGEDESIASVTIDLPEGSMAEAQNVKVTVLQGLERLDVESEVSIEGNTHATISFPEPTPAGSLVMVEFNRTLLPADSGSYGMSGSYVDAEGAESAIPDSAITIEVVGVSKSEQVSAWLGEQEWVQAWNSNKFLNLFLNPQVAVTAVPVVFNGWLVALGLVVVGFPLAIPLGLMWAFLRMAKNRFLRGLGGLYINIIRGTPLFLQIYIAFFGLPLLGIQLNNFALGIIVLMMNSSAYMAEIFRAGIQSINKGQFEAARSLGMNGVQTMFSVILPQTIRRVTPTMTSEFILLYKDTSLLAAVGVYEIMMFSKSITAATGNVTPYIIAACFYLLVTIPLTKFVNTLEDRMDDNRPKKSKRKRKRELNEATTKEAYAPVQASEYPLVQASEYSPVKTSEHPPVHASPLAHGRPSHEDRGSQAGL